MGRDDTLPKHASVFTGLPSTANSVYPSVAARVVSSNSDVAAGGNDGGLQACRRRRRGRKNVTFESDLRAPSQQQQELPFCICDSNPRPGENTLGRGSNEGSQWDWVETVTTFKILVPAHMDFPDDIQVYLPRRGKGRPNTACRPAPLREHPRADSVAAPSPPTPRR